MPHEDMGCTGLQLHQHCQCAIQARLRERTSLRELSSHHPGLLWWHGVLSRPWGDVHLGELSAE